MCKYPCDLRNQEPWTPQIHQQRRCCRCSPKLHRVRRWKAFLSPEISALPLGISLNQGRFIKKKQGMENPKPQETTGFPLSDFAKLWRGFSPTVTPTSLEGGPFRRFAKVMVNAFAMVNPPPPWNALAECPMLQEKSNLTLMGKVPTQRGYLHQCQVIL